IQYILFTQQTTCKHLFKMTRFALILLVSVATVGVMVQALPTSPILPIPPLPTPSCQRWCPRPGQLGQYDCCEDGLIHSGQCPSVRLECPAARFQSPQVCSDDGEC
ncbi:unnamed protein product, partial [Meganyctiphanes norvegica]